MVDLTSALSSIAVTDPVTFRESLLRVIVDGLNLRAATLYLYTDEARSLSLKAQTGFSYRAFFSFQLPLGSHAGHAALSDAPIIELDPLRSPLFHNKQLVRITHVGGLVAAPLRLGSHRTIFPLAPSDPIGVLCLYPHVNRSISLDGIADWVAEHGPFISQLYLANLERYTLRFRKAFLDRVAFRRDIGSLTYSFLALIRSEFNVEAGSLWVLDDRRDHLYLRKATPLARGRHEKEIKPIPLDSDSLVARCFTGGTALFHNAASPRFEPRRVLEKLKHSLRNGGMFPIVLHPDAMLRGRHPIAAGVLILLNHSTVFGQVSHVTDLDWEDRYLVSFACELLSVVLYPMLRTRDHESDFERLMHAARTSLNAARSNLQYLEKFHLENHLPPEQRYYIPNAIDWLEDLEAQVNRDEMIRASGLSLRAVNLYGDVLANLGPMVNRMATRLGISDLQYQLTGAEATDGRRHPLPAVQGNREALACIFRNLIDNSLKYRNKLARDPTSILLSARSHEGVKDDDRGTVVVRIEDNGIGIDQGESTLIFNLGFRGRRAVGRQPTGIGRGLFECRELLTRMGGSITLRESREFDHGAAFEVTLQQARRSTRRGQSTGRRRDS